MNKFEWTCPYCGTKNTIRTDERKELLYCDVEIGGCDKLSVVKFFVTTSTEVLKVQGEGEAYDAEREQAITENEWTLTDQVKHENKILAKVPDDTTVILSEISPSEY